MKKILLIAAFIISSFTYGQVSVAKALKLVAITTAQRDALTINTNEHPVIYNFTTGNFERYNGTAWEEWGGGGGGASSWGFITGTLSDQTDLQAALDLKSALAGGTFTGDISVPTEVYGISWDGSNEVATKDALYDKIEAVVSAGGAASLTDLSDVNTATVTNRNVLVADGVDFESRALVEADISDLSHIANTDAQDLTLTGNTLAVTGDPNTDVSLAAYLDNTDTQDLSLAANTLSLVNGGNVDLSGYLDNTDAQDLTLTTNTLALTGDGTTVDLSGYLDDTDTQTSIDDEGTTLTAAVTKFDFIGDGVTVTEPFTDEMDVTINDGTADTSPTSSILHWMGTKAQLYSEFGNPVTGVPANYVLYVTDSVTTITASDVINVASGNLIATDVQAALDELQTELDGAGGGGDLSTVDIDTFAELDAIVADESLVNTNDTQTLTNKTFTDNVFSIADNLDATKIIQFQASSLATGQTRTMTIPNGNGTVSLTELSETLLNKTLNSPILVTPALGTPSSGVATNLTGTAAGLTVGATTGVEAGADVTDTANVTAAGALMDSEVDADIQTMTIAASSTISGSNTGDQNLADTVAEITDLDNDAATLTIGASATVTGSNTGDSQTLAAGVSDVTATASEINTPLDGALVTLTEFQELETIGATVISAADWTAVSNLAGTNTGDQTIEYKFIVPLGGSGDALAVADDVTHVPVLDAITITRVEADVLTAPTGAGITLDIELDDGTPASIFSTLLTIDATERFTSTAATAAVVSDATIPADSFLTFNVDVIGSTIAGAGGTVTIYYTID